MFKPKYKLEIVNPEKNIVSLQVTKGTWLKYAVLPCALYAAGFAALIIAGSKTDDERYTVENAKDDYLKS
jgi:hypothetical protein